MLRTGKSEMCYYNHSLVSAVHTNSLKNTAKAVRQCTYIQEMNAIAEEWIMKEVA